MVQVAACGWGRGHDSQRQYVDQFREIRSEFTRVVDGEVGVLEWTSSGRLSSGTEISYSGVSVLDGDGDGDGRVVRFATYYDTMPFGGAGMTGQG